MAKLFSYVSIGSIWLSFASLIFLFFYFGVNKKKYEKIIDLYHEKGFSLYVPYHFHSLVGFFGSFTLVYYFLCLKKKKKPMLMFYKNPNVYTVFDDIPESLSGWMKAYYRVTLFALFCLLFALMMGLMKYIDLKFFFVEI